MGRAILRVYSRRGEDAVCCEKVRIDEDAREILGEVQRETGLSFKAIASAFIKACADDYEVRIIK